MSRERGQALVEAVAALPVCVASALLLVDAGIIVRDRIAVSQAATRAVEATIEGRDAAAAAHGALPAALRSAARVEISGATITVSVQSRATSARLVHQPVVLASRARLDSVEVTR
ncbi:MAG: hypothetical protein JWM86_759 [Thermoleophilia bacterium]|nr:hypothetical protein [Thermoleophilia bacterium]